LTAWTTGELQRIGTAGELQIASQRPDGRPSGHRIIWVVCTGRRWSTCSDPRGGPGPSPAAPPTGYLRGDDRPVDLKGSCGPGIPPYRGWPPRWPGGRSSGRCGARAGRAGRRGDDRRGQCRAAGRRAGAAGRAGQGPAATAGNPRRVTRPRRPVGRGTLPASVRRQLESSQGRGLGTCIVVGPPFSSTWFTIAQAWAFGPYGLESENMSSAP
jgi:hypothetical protein